MLALSSSRISWLQRLILLALVSVLTASARADGNTTVYALDSHREPLVSLDNGWRFHPGDDPAWASPDYDDSAWPILHADAPWSSQGYAGMSGFGWYRFTLTLPANHPPLAILLAPIMTSYRFYLDGQLVRQVGSTPGSILPSAIWDYQIFSLPEPSSNTHTVHVALRVWHCPVWSSYMGGGPESPGSLFGSLSLLQQEQHHRREHRRLLLVDIFAYTIAGFMIAITVFGLYAFRPHEREYLWFGLVILAKTADAMLTISKELYAVPSIPIFDLLDGTCVATAQIALSLFLSRVLALRRGWPWRTVALLAAISPLCNILYWPGLVSVPLSGSLQILLLLPSSIWMLSVLTRGALRRNGTALLLIFPVFLAQGFWVADNLVILLAQYGLPIEARFLEKPLAITPYAIHPATLDELLFLLAMLAFLILRFTAARRREERFESELEAARQVQQVVLPAQVAETPGFAVECVYHPADRVGGDFFQVLPLPDGSLFVVVGDVAGKGLPAALMVSMLVGVAHAETAHTSDPAAILATLNAGSCGRMQGKLTTCLCLHIDMNGNVRAANAGHLNPYIDGIEVVLEPALPLGILRGIRYPVTQFSLRMGERLTLVSDGVIEARSREGELFGFDRTRAISTQSAVEIVAAARGFGQNDDITVLTIAYLGVEASATLQAAS